MMTKMKKMSVLIYQVTRFARDNNFMDIQSNAVTTDESIVLKLAEDVYFLVIEMNDTKQIQNKDKKH